MAKTIFIFTSLGILWCFGLGLYINVQSSTAKIAQPKTSLLAQATSTLLVQTNIQTKPDPVKVLFFGDMMLDRKVRGQIEANGPEYPFALIKDFLRNASSSNDIVVANAEGPFTDNNSVTLGVKNGPLQFTFDPAVLPTLRNLGFTLLDQANNHSLNFGLSGFNQSTAYITADGLNWFGDPRNENVVPYVANIHDQKIAFIGYNEFAYQGLNNILQAVIDAKKDSDFVVVYSHWGDEYELNATSSQQKTAHAFIDAGADAVIGAHPHVIQPIEIYKGKPIFYSLGNFIFDQASTGPTSQGLAVKLSLDSYSATYNLFPILIVNQQASLMASTSAQKILDRLNVQNGEIKLSR